MGEPVSQTPPRAMAYICARYLTYFEHIVYSIKCVWVHVTRTHASWLKHTSGSRRPFCVATKLAFPPHHLANKVNCGEPHNAKNATRYVKLSKKQTSVSGTNTKSFVQEWRENQSSSPIWCLIEHTPEMQSLFFFLLLYTTWSRKFAGSSVHSYLFWFEVSVCDTS